MFAAVEVDEPSEIAGVTGVVGLTNMVLSGVDGSLSFACGATIDGSAGPLSLTHPTINKIKVMHSKASLMIQDFIFGAGQKKSAFSSF